MDKLHMFVLFACKVFRSFLENCINKTEVLRFLSCNQQNKTKFKHARTKLTGQEIIPFECTF